MVILGECEERQKLEQLAQEMDISTKVYMPGFDSNPFKYMKKCDVFVLSSRYEGLPGALIQAMVFGKPIVATDCPGGVREILQDGKWGAIVPLDDPEAMAEAILEGLENRLPDPSPRALDFASGRIVEEYLLLMDLKE